MGKDGDGWEEGERRKGGERSWEVGRNSLLCDVLKKVCEIKFDLKLINLGKFYYIYEGKNS